MAIPPKRKAEIDQIEGIYSVALSTLGINVIAEALDLWQDVPPLPGHVDRALASFVAKIGKVTGLRRKHARQIAIPYYRLVRALVTGFTTQAVDTGALKLHDGDTVTLDDLREDFYDIVNTLTPEALEDGEAGSSGNDTVEVEEIEDLDEDLEKLEKRQDEIHELDQQRDALLTVRTVHDIKTEGRQARVVDDDREEARRAGGSRAAAKAQMSTLDGARQTVDTIAEKDPRALGWIRYSTTGTPCGFCAMLIARGFVAKGEDIKVGVLYKSEASARNRSADNEKYHPRCKCRAIPIFDDSGIESDPKFALNRKYARLWPSVTEDLSGREALNAWRTYLRNHPEEVSATGQVA